jgi:hypothetical protein
MAKRLLLAIALMLCFILGYIFGFMNNSQNITIQIYREGRVSDEKANIDSLQEDIDRTKKMNFIPDLHGVKLMFVGVTPTQNISNEHWQIH